jgi:hypothetical protein
MASGSSVIRALSCGVVTATIDEASGRLVTQTYPQQHIVLV